jgi:hypothetical protein
METIRNASIAQAVPVVQGLRGLATLAAGLCAAAFMLLTATAFSNTIARIAGGAAADWGQFAGQFAMPSVPLALSLGLLALHARASAGAIAIGGTALYLLLWVTIAY